MKKTFIIVVLGLLVAGNIPSFADAQNPSLADTVANTSSTAATNFRSSTSSIGVELGQRLNSSTSSNSNSYGSGSISSAGGYGSLLANLWNQLKQFIMQLIAQVKQNLHMN